MRLREGKGGPSHPGGGVRPEGRDDDDSGGDGGNPYAWSCRVHFLVMRLDDWSAVTYGMLNWEAESLRY